jgi:hypothetical protein
MARWNQAKTPANPAVNSDHSHISFRTILFACVLATSGAAATGCSGSAKPSSGVPAEFRKGERPFAFDYEAVTDFLVVKADPDSGDRWTARLKKEKGVWQLEGNNPAGEPMQDRRADVFFVLHLLDTLRTLQVSDPVAPGPDTSLGLAPPRFALQWRTPAQGSGPAGEYELRVGAPVHDSPRAFAWTPDHAAFVTEGAALQMLANLVSFDWLRLKTWTGITPDGDDIDEIESFRDGKSVFYAQREGSDWTDRKHKRMKKDYSEWLKQATRQRVLRFVDSAEEAKGLRMALESRPLREVALKNRAGATTRLRLGVLGKQVFGLSSSRPEGVFELYPAAVQSLEIR